MSSFDRATIRSIASSQVAGTSRPSRRTSGIVRRSALAFASQPWRPFGPSRPWFTRSSPRPRTPTMRPPATPMSMPQPVEQRTQTEETHRSTSATVRASTRTGQEPAACGVRGPQMSSMLFRVSATSACLPLPWGLVERVQLPLDPAERRLHLVIAVLRLVAALVDEVRRRDDEGEDLQELRLPVLHRPFAEVDDVAVEAPDLWCLTVGDRVCDVLPPAEDGVEDERGGEHREHDDAQAVV